MSVCCEINDIEMKYKSSLLLPPQLPYTAGLLRLLGLLHSTGPNQHLPD